MNRQIVLLAKPKLNNIEVLLLKSLINLNIRHNDFVLINNMQKQYDKMKERVKNLKA